MLKKYYFLLLVLLPSLARSMDQDPSDQYPLISVADVIAQAEGSLKSVGLIIEEAQGILALDWDSPGVSFTTAFGCNLEERNQALQSAEMQLNLSQVSLASLKGLIECTPVIMDALRDTHAALEEKLQKAKSYLTISLEKKTNQASDEDGIENTWSINKTGYTSLKMNCSPGAMLDFITIKTTIFNLFDEICENYCQEMKIKRKKQHVINTVKYRIKFVKNVLKSSAKYILSEDDRLFCYGSHASSFDPTALSNGKIPICIDCCNRGLSNAFELYSLADVKGKACEDILGKITSFKGQYFGAIDYNSTPLWEDVYQSVAHDLSVEHRAKQKFDFLEVASGFNPKPLAIWLLGQGKINCIVNDINYRNCNNFLWEYFFLDPAEVKECHKQATITLDKSDFLKRKFSANGNLFDYIVITNFFHYLRSQEKIANAMDELKKITKPGSLVYLQALSGANENLEKHLVGQDYEPIYPLGDFFTYFPLTSLKKLAADHGFEVIGSGHFYKSRWFAWVKLKKIS